MKSLGQISALYKLILSFDPSFRFECLIKNFLQVGMKQIGKIKEVILWNVFGIMM